MGRVYHHRRSHMNGEKMYVLNPINLYLRSRVALVYKARRKKQAPEACGCACAGSGARRVVVLVARAGVWPTPLQRLDPRAALLPCRASGRGRAGGGKTARKTAKRERPDCPARARTEPRTGDGTGFEKRARRTDSPWTPGDYWTEEYNISNNILSPQRGQVQRAATPTCDKPTGTTLGCAQPHRGRRRHAPGGAAHAAGEAVRVEHGLPRRSTRILNKLTCAQQRSTVGRCTPLRARTSLLASWITSDHTIMMAPLAPTMAPTSIRRNGEIISSSARLLSGLTLTFITI